MPPFSCTDWVVMEMTLVTSKLFAGLGGDPFIQSIWKSAHQMCHSSHPALVWLVKGMRGRGDKASCWQFLMNVLEQAALENCHVSLATFCVLMCSQNLRPVIDKLPFHSADSLQWVPQSHSPMAFVERGQGGWCFQEGMGAEFVVGKKKLGSSICTLITPEPWQGGAVLGN